MKAHRFIQKQKKKKEATELTNNTRNEVQQIICD